MNIYTQEEIEAQAALQIAQALESTHGWTHVKAVIEYDGEENGKRRVKAYVGGVTPTKDNGLNYNTHYVYDDGGTDLAAHVIDGALGHDARVKPASKSDAKAQASERLGATLDTLRAAVADSDLTRADVEAETEAVQTAAQPKAKAPAAPAKRHAGRKTTPKGKK